jgi:hypothetical protein
LSFSNVFSLKKNLPAIKKFSIFKCQVYAFSYNKPPFNPHWFHCIRKKTLIINLYSYNINNVLFLIHISNTGHIFLYLWEYFQFMQDVWYIIKKNHIELHCQNYIYLFAPRCLWVFFLLLNGMRIFFFFVFFFLELVYLGISREWKKTDFINLSFGKHTP